MEGLDVSELKYFPKNEDEQGFILQIYADEIQLRTSWIVSVANEINQSLKQNESASTIFRQAMDLIGNAIVILRIIDPTGARRNEIERTNERVDLIRKNWPNIPTDPPEGLRDVRNDYEHYDARLDQWAISSERKIIADMNIGPIIGGTEIHENLRRFQGDTLYFWDHAVSLSKVLDWAIRVNESVSNKTNEMNFI